MLTLLCKSILCVHYVCWTALAERLELEWVQVREYPGAHGVRAAFVGWLALEWAWPEVISGCAVPGPPFGEWLQLV